MSVYLTAKTFDEALHGPNTRYWRVHRRHWRPDVHRLNRKTRKALVEQAGYTATSKLVKCQCVLSGCTEYRPMKKPWRYS